MQLKSLGLAIVALFTITACSESSQTTQTTFNEADGSGEIAWTFSVDVPGSLENVRALDQDALFAEVRIRVNGVDRPVVDTSSEISFTAPDGSDLVIEITWYELQANGVKLKLASHEVSQQVNGNTTIIVNSADYDSSIFDDDNDSYSNLEEVAAGSNPFESESMPANDGTGSGIVLDNVVDVVIPRISQSNAPIIDGFYDAVYAYAEFDDVKGELLSIHNLMIDQGKKRDDGGIWPEFDLRWYALHDDINLYVFIEGEKQTLGSPTRDSTVVWNDDTVNLFFDGDNSKGSSYDQVDDRHFMVPLLTSPDDLSVNSTVVVQGANSATISGLEFKTCVCGSDTNEIEGQYAWEIKVPLSSFGIERGVPFGFDVQIDLDHDGDARDARWAWFHPSRTTVDVNNTITDPSFMGTVVLSDEIDEPVLGFKRF